MGLFGAFKGNKTIPRVDMVWQTNAAKYKGCLDFIKNNKVDICVAWFENTKEQFNDFLNTKNRLNVPISMATTLFPFSLDNKSVLFLEHYPLFSKEENLIGKSKPSKIWFVNSLEDGVLKVFSGNVGEMMKKMGMEADECLEHKLISKSILNAQKKLEKHTLMDYSAKSGDDWIRQFQANKK